jgi:hypothetical protein
MSEIQIEFIDIGEYLYAKITGDINAVPDDLQMESNFLIYYHDNKYKVLYMLNDGFYWTSLYKNGEFLQGSYSSSSEIFDLGEVIVPKNVLIANNSQPFFNSETYKVNGISPLPVDPINNGGGMEGGGGGMGGGGAGAGSDPYITTFSGYTFELPHLNKHWELFSHKPTDFSIIAHTHNYPHGNYFNFIKVNYGKSKITIDYQKKKITTNNSAFKIGKTELTMKYNKKGKIINETKLFDCIVFNHTEFKEVALIINWRNHYFHPIFQIKPTKNCSGLLMMKEPSKTL